MEITVNSSDADSLVLAAPFAPNRNSLNTAFGGSLVTLATLAGYGVVWELMSSAEHGLANWSIVIRDSAAAYRRPVHGDLRARCARPDPATTQDFFRALARYGKAKLKLRPEVVEEGVVAVDLRATYVVRRV